MLMFASALPENADGAGWARFTSAGRCTIKTRKELLATIKPHQWQYLRKDTGDVPEGGPRPTPAARHHGAGRLILSASCELSAFS